MFSMPSSTCVLEFALSLSCMSMPKAVRCTTAKILLSTHITFDCLWCFASLGPWCNSTAPVVMVEQQHSARHSRRSAPSSTHYCTGTHGYGAPAGACHTSSLVQHGSST